LQLVSDALEGVQPVSCPAKEIFFRRSNTEHNWRKANFRVADVWSLSGCLKDQISFHKHIHTASFQDFFIHCRCDDDIWHLYWFDESGETAIQSKSLTRPKSDRVYIVDAMFPASNKVPQVYFCSITVPSICYLA
jgi:hypothetical protein